MDLRDILDDTFDLYKENFVLLITIAAIVFLPFSLLISLVTGGAPAPTAPGTSPAVAIQYAGMQFVAFFLATVGSYIATAALTRAISERYLGRKITFREAYSSILERFGPFLLTLILPFLIVGAASFVILLVGVGIIAGLTYINTILGIVAGVVLTAVMILSILYLFFGITFVLPVFIVENRVGWDAVKRSFQLFMFSPLKVFGTIFLVMIIVSIITGMALLPFIGVMGFMAMEEGPVSQALITLQGALNGVAQSIFQPIQSIVILLLYYDIRIRREGFDLEVMANDLRTNVASSPGELGGADSLYTSEEPPSSLQ